MVCRSPPAAPTRSAPYLTLGSRFLYVLNRGVNGSGNGDCYGTGASACQNSNITQFAVGGNGILTSQETFYTQGINPFRLIADTSGSYLFVLDHDAPDNANPSTKDNCALALGTAVTTCGDITVFKIDQTTGRLSLVDECPGDGSQRPAADLFPGSGQSRRFCPESAGSSCTLTGARSSHLLPISPVAPRSSLITTPAPLDS